MNTKFTLLFAVLLCFTTSTSIFAQDSIKGTVVDADSGEALIGVNIVVKGTSKGTTTDFDGNFEVATAPPATIIFSYIGYMTEEKMCKQAKLSKSK